jgi:hypothetical protein
VKKFEYDALTYAIGAREAASVHLGRADDPEKVVERRLQEAEAALVATRATDLAGLLCKLEIVWEHVDDHRHHFGRLVGELEDCQLQAGRRDPDLAGLADALTVLAHRFEREEASDFDVGLLKSAAIDARQLSRADS